MVFIKVTLDFKHLFVVRSVNGGGELACFWDDTLSLQLLFFSAQHVYFSVTQGGGLAPW